MSVIVRMKMRCGEIGASMNGKEDRTGAGEGGQWAYYVLASPGFPLETR